MSEYRGRYTFGMDYGTSDYKYGPITCKENPMIIENRGYFPDKESVMFRAFEKPKDIIVGQELPLYLQASEELSTRLIYPMKNGVIEKNDERAWQVVSEISRYGLNAFKPKEKDFEGFYVVASVSSVSPKYMYEKLFEIYRQIDEEERLVKAVTIIPQPFAVAIGHGITTCVVIESGHGNSQLCPLSKYPIRDAVLAIDRGGGDANALTAEILKDLGYGDLAQQETFVRKVKETVGLIPVRLEEAVEAAKKNPDKFKAKFKVPGTRIVVDFEENSWMRFLIGEYVFDPNHQMFQSYFTRGMRKPKDVKIGDTIFRGMMDFGEAIVQSVERCPLELQPHLYREIVLSGGNFSWNVPEKLEGIATDSMTKIRLLLKEKGITNVKVTMTKSPQLSVWHGCIIYGFAVPDDYAWNWERMEGWLKLHD